MFLISEANETDKIVAFIAIQFYLFWSRLLCFHIEITKSCTYLEIV